MSKLIAALAVSVSLAVVPAAAAHKRHHHHARHHARITSQGREYWPILEEWLTPQEGREVEQSVTEELDEVADA